MLHRKAERFHGFLSPGTVGPSAEVVHPVAIRSPGEGINEARVAPSGSKIVALKSIRRPRRSRETLTSGAASLVGRMGQFHGRHDTLPTSLSRARPAPV